MSIANPLRVIAVFVAIATGTVVSPAATKHVRTVIGELGAPWADGAQLKVFHGELADRFKDTPPLADLWGPDRWFVAVDGQ